MDSTFTRAALASCLTTSGMAAFQEVIEGRGPLPTPPPPPPPEITLFLQQIPDVIFEIASQLPTETALCLALTCKPLYTLLFRRTLRRITRRQRHLFLFTLMRDLGSGISNDHYYCHTCSKICIWRCPLERSHGPCEKCPPITLTTEHHDLNAQKHACVRRGYFTLTIPELEEYKAHKSVALHMDRTGWRKCCEYSERPGEIA